MNLLEGDLTFAKEVKLYTHKCFQRYPHFQVDDLDTNPKTVTNNSTHLNRNPRTHREIGRGNKNTGRGRGRDRYNGSRSSQPSSPPRNYERRPKGKGKSTGRQKGKGKGKSPATSSGTRHPHSQNQGPVCLLWWGQSRCAHLLQTNRRLEIKNPKDSQTSHPKHSHRRDHHGILSICSLCPPA
jgi:hypothetical protein